MSALFVVVAPPRQVDASPAVSPLDDDRLIPGEVLLGALTMAGVGLVAIPMTLVGGEAGLGAAVVMGPALGGLVVCQIGKSSEAYEGTCGAAILGAYVGALSVIPLGYLGCALDTPTGDEGGACLEGAVVGIIAGFTLGTAIGATIGWNVGKQPKQPNPGLFAPPPISRAPALAGEASRVARGAEVPRLVVPVLAFGF